VHYPPEGNLQEGEIVLLRNLLHHGQGVKGCVPEVTLAVVLAGGRLGAEPRILVLRVLILGLDLAREETAGEGVVDDNVDTVPVASGDGFDVKVASLGSAQADQIRHLTH
jgi:hypothetical protein